ncbi:terpenoid synthase [Fomitiporia mediterranea MF3/22]|uniref:terpenoid synthase n=1 Tax=Fomitiporia mediterranea (strain MF3/22) TaxID=694068 RepID=UPI0004409B97|nr:terpenoid synthase [Fomitiporia mediterranea MF3/22]EJD04456.1 terpenoid synthase [Fomitiporia mediterranea MF3/22]
MNQYTVLVVPDLLSLIPYTWDKCNPLYSPDKRESIEWMLKYNVLTNHRRNRLDGLNVELSGAYQYPSSNAEGLRIATDFVMILFTVDEFTDVQDADSAKTTRDVFVNALNGVSSNDKSPIALFTKDFMTRLSRIASPEVRERFVSHCVAYINATAKEATLRATNKKLSFEEYTHLRRDNGGELACFDLIEAVLRIALPAEVFEDPSFQAICCSMNDLICLANDIYSYPMEYSRGIDQVNAVTAIKHEKVVSTQEAIDLVADHYKKLVKLVGSCKRSLPSFGPETDDAIHTYIHGIEQWFYGYIVWCFDTPRYFGKEHEDMKCTMTVKVMQHKFLD